MEGLGEMGGKYYYFFVDCIIVQAVLGG